MDLVKLKEFRNKEKKTAGKTIFRILNQKTESVKLQTLTIHSENIVKDRSLHSRLYKSSTNA